MKRRQSLQLTAVEPNHSEQKLKILTFTKCLKVLCLKSEVIEGAHSNNSEWTLSSYKAVHFLLTSVVHPLWDQEYDANTAHMSCTSSRSDNCHTF
eukprot:scaffold17413_cov55-Cyclotella_meneghiniana.AAC.10